MALTKFQRLQKSVTSGFFKSNIQTQKKAATTYVNGVKKKATNLVKAAEKRAKTQLDRECPISTCDESGKPRGASKRRATSRKSTTKRKATSTKKSTTGKCVVPKTINQFGAKLTRVGLKPYTSKAQANAALDRKKVKGGAQRSVKKNPCGKGYNAYAKKK